MTTVYGWLKNPTPRLAALLALAAAVTPIIGCGTTRLTEPRRTASEQYLMTRAAQESLAPLDLSAYANRRVYLDPRPPQVGTQAERAFMHAQLRAQLLEAGAHLVPSHDEAEVVLELRSAGLGIDRNQLEIGIPPNTAGIALRIFYPEVPINIRHPQINIVDADRQWGAGSAAIVAYWQDTGDIYSYNPRTIGRSFLERWKVILLGSRTLSNVPTTVDPLEAATRDLLDSPAPPADADAPANEIRRPPQVPQLPDEQES